MNKIDYQALREAAQKAKELGNISRYTKAMIALLEFKEAATPDAVLALLDELDKWKQESSAWQVVAEKQLALATSAEQKIAELASPAAVSDERAAYELFMEKRFGESVDRRRAKNGDREYMAWDMALGWIIWCHRAAMLQCSEPEQEWIPCSERMPDKLIPVMVMYEDGEMWSAMWNGNRWDDGTEYPDPHSVTHWREMPAAPQLEVNRG
ncbi:TPA: DUF551 domain-containing protein [Escherichia coli]|nr:DUF551 domain-containing protein [Escherichia coli]HCJ6168185.1 DUF551 domain-containing protein [Escherichia coli]HCJ8812755.1 DUF551 domain-containing protein [Escherichia coli]